MSIIPFEMCVGLVTEPPTIAEVPYKWDGSDATTAILEGTPSITVKPNTTFAELNAMTDTFYDR